MFGSHRTEGHCKKKKDAMLSGTASPISFFIGNGLVDKGVANAVFVFTPQAPSASRLKLRCMHLAFLHQPVF